MSRTGLAQPADYLDHFGRRLMTDAIQNAHGDQLRRRAVIFEWTAPRPGDFTGRATPADLEDQRRRAVESANECRWRAWAVDGADVTHPPVLQCPDCRTTTSPWSCSCGRTRVGGCP